MMDSASACDRVDESDIPVLFSRAGHAGPSLERLQAAFRNVVSEEHPDSVVLFGCGSWGRSTARRLASANVEVAAFTDNDTRLWGTTVEGIVVESPQVVLAGRGRDVLVVVTVYNGAAIRRQLQALGFTRVLSAIAFYYGMNDLFIPYYQLDGPECLFESRDDIAAVDGIWADAVSRQVFASRVSTMLGLPADLDEPVGAPRDCYVDPSLLTLDSTDRLVDCGAFDGDTIRRLFERGIFPSQIDALEPDPCNAAALRDFVSTLDASTADRINVVEAAASSSSGRLAFAASGTVAAQVGSGDVSVRTIALDEFSAAERPTYIKMDIEGHELDALRGAVTLMRETPPILAISLYHRAADLWQVPMLIHRTNPAYRLFLRCYAEDGWESVCYAIPPTRAVAASTKR